MDDGTETEVWVGERVGVERDLFCLLMSPTDVVVHSSILRHSVTTATTTPTGSDVGRGRGELASPSWLGCGGRHVRGWNSRHKPKPKPKLPRYTPAL